MLQSQQQDFLVESLNAKKIYEIYSYSFPHSVFVNEENLVELPLVQIFYKKLKNKELMILAGDVQPLDERNCYEFCQEILEIFKKHKEHYPGQHIPVDIVAANNAKKNHIEVFCIGGKNRKNLDALLSQKPWKGTRIHI